jgi:hypothetical protein
MKKPRVNLKKDERKLTEKVSFYVSKVHQLEQIIEGYRTEVKVLRDRLAVRCTNCNKTREQSGVSPSMKGKSGLCTACYRAREHTKLANRKDKFANVIKGLETSPNKTMTEKAEEEYQKNLEIYQKSKLSRES